MANFRGKTTKGVNLLIHAPKAGIYEGKPAGDGEKAKRGGRFLDVQIDQSSFGEKAIKEGKCDTNPHLNSWTAKYTNPAGEEVTYVSHREFYTDSQFEKMVEAAGKKCYEIQDGKYKGDMLLGINADIISNKKKNLIVATNKPMTTTTNKSFGPGALDRQEKNTALAKEVRDLARAKDEKVNVKEVEVEETKAVEAEAELAPAE